MDVTIDEFLGTDDCKVARNYLFGRDHDSLVSELELEEGVAACFNEHVVRRTPVGPLLPGLVVSVLDLRGEEPVLYETGFYHRDADGSIGRLGYSKVHTNTMVDASPEIGGEFCSEYAEMITTAVLANPENLGPRVTAAMFNEFEQQKRPTGTRTDHVSYKIKRGRR